MKAGLIRASMIGAAAWLSLQPNLWAEEVPALSGSVAVPVNSAYVWRGIVVSDKPVAQPNATLSKYGFSLNTWANYNFTDNAGPDAENEFNEVDLTLSYSRSVGPVVVGASYAEYLYPHQILTAEDGTGSPVPGTREIALSAGAPGVLLAPTLTVVRDIDEIDGFYATLALSHSFTLTDKVALGLGFSTGVGDGDYNNGYYGVEKARLNDGNVSASLPIALTKSLTLTPLVQYTWLWDSEIRDQAKTLYKDDESVWGGVTLSIAL